MIGIADRVRSSALRYVAQTRWRPFVAQRSRRIGVRAAVAVVFALVLASTAPALALAIGPLVFGVPHVAASLRYLVVRRGVSRSLLGAIVLASLVVVATRLATGATPSGVSLLTCTRIEVGAGGVLFVIACVEALRRSRRILRGVAALGILAAGLAVALHAPFAARLAFVHIHNLGVVALWILLFRRHGLLPKLVGLGLVVSLLLLATGATLPLAQGLGGLRAAGVDCTTVAEWLAPGLLATFAMPLVVMHAFTDSVHYAFWLSVVPEEELRGEGSLTFRMTARGVLRDFGALGVGLVAAAALGIAVLGYFRGGLGRDAYFAVAGFHGYVEGAMLVYFLVHGGQALERVEPPGRAEPVSAPPCDALSVRRLVEVLDGLLKRARVHL